ncbi:MAG: DUF748 domain-containing protein [Desulfobacterales bacterium]|nr:DUF748 domain-containing protein [Desulfobacterales bacterium]
MKIKQFRQNFNRLQKTAVILSILFIFYILFGFFILPPIIKIQMVKNIHKATNRNVTLEKVRFNPLVLSLTLQNFNIEGKGGEAFVGWQEFYINFQLSTIFRFAWTFDEIRLIKPGIFIEKVTADTFNFSDLIPESSTETKENETKENAEEDNKIPPVRINKLIFDGGRFHLRDSSRGGNADFSLDSVSFELDNFKTRLKPDQNNTYDFKAVGPKGGFLHWNGTFRLTPLESKGLIELSGIHLTSFINFFKDELQFTMPRGLLGFSTQYHVFGNPEWGVELSQGDYTFTDLLITEKETEDTLFELPFFDINNVGLSLNDQKITVGDITVKDARLNPSINKSGEMNLLKAFDMSAFKNSPENDVPAESKKTDIEETEKTYPGWYWEVGSFNIDSFGVNFSDNMPQTPFNYSVYPVHLQVKDIVSDGHKPFNLTFSSILNETGSISASGSGTVKPVSLSVDINKKNHVLKDFQPYIDRFAHITILDGTNDGTMHVEVNMDENGEFTKLHAEGDDYINNLNLHDNVTNKDLVKWKKYAAEGIKVDILSNHATINKITLTEPDLNFQINENFTTNIQQLIVSSEKKEHGEAAEPDSEDEASDPETETEPIEETKKTSENPFQVSINEIVIENGTAGFADLSLKPDFITEIGQLNGLITGSSNIPGKTATVDIKGKVDHHAPVFIKGKSNLLAEKQTADITVSFKNIEMSSFTPYSGTYAGYKIDKGQLSVDLQYLLNANELHGNNKIVINKLEFGDKVESEKAINLPLKLAVALLSDANGVIDLGLVVEGDLNDPEFNIGGIIWKVLKNLIVKAVSSPFTLLAGLVDGGEDLNIVTFSPGKDLPEGDEYEKVVQLAGALAERPKLSLNIRGQVAYKSDLHSLKQMYLDNMLTATSEINAAEIGGVLSAARERKWRNTLFDLYKDSFDESWRDVRDRLTEEAGVNGEEIDKELLFNRTVEVVYNALIDKQPITEENLHILADNRSRNIKVELVENHAIDPGRIFILESEISPGTESSAVEMTLDAL